MDRHNNESEGLGPCIRRWLPAFLVGILCVAATGASLRLAARKVVGSLLRTSAIKPKLIFRLDADIAKENRRWREWREQLVALTTNRVVLNAALRHSEVRQLKIVREQANPVEWLRSVIRADFLGSEILRVSIYGDNPQELEILVNAVTQAILAEFEEFDQEVSPRVRLLEKATVFSPPPVWTKMALLARALYSRLTKPTGTGQVYEDDFAKVRLDDLTGWLMMLFALGLFAIELKILAGLLIPASAQRPVPTPDCQEGDQRPTAAVAPAPTK